MKLTTQLVLQNLRTTTVISVISLLALFGGFSTGYAYTSTQSDTLIATTQDGTKESTRSLASVLSAFFEEIQEKTTQPIAQLDEKDEADAPSQDSQESTKDSNDNNSKNKYDNSHDTRDGVSEIDPTPSPSVSPSPTPEPSVTTEPSPTAVPVTSPSPSPSLSPSPTPAATSSPTSTFTVPFVQGSAVPNAAGNVTLVVHQHATGYWQFEPTGSVTSLQPNRTYQLWLCGINCSSASSSARFQTDDNGNASFSGFSITHAQWNNPVSRVNIWEVHPGGQVIHQPDTCFGTSNSSPTCLHATVAW